MEKLINEFEVITRWPKKFNLKISKLEKILITLLINSNYFWNNRNSEIVQQAKKENSSAF